MNVFAWACIMLSFMKALEKKLTDHRCLIFIDLEGTQTSHEIIEIGAYKVLLRDDLTIKKIFKPYHAFVLAKHRVGPIVTKLTGITDLQLKREGIPFRTMQLQLKKYIGKDFKNPLFVSYGPTDATMFLASSENNMDASTDEARFVARHFFDLAAFVGQYLRDEKNDSILSLTNALKAYEVDFEGTAHNAQDDAYNLLLLYKAFLEKPHITLEHYMKVLGRAGHLPGPIAAVIARLNKGETVTPEVFRKCAEDALK